MIYYQTLELARCKTIRRWKKGGARVQTDRNWGMLNTQTRKQPSDQQDTDWLGAFNQKKNRRARPQNPGLRVHSEPKKIHILREKHWKPLTELSPSLMLWSLLPDIEAPLNDLKTVCSCWEVPGWSNWFWNWHPLDNIWKIKIPFEGFTFLLSDQKTSWAGPIPGPSKSQDFLFVSPLSNFWMLSPKTSGIFA